MSNLKVLVISGSPRTNGNTEALAKAFLKPIEQQEINVQWIHVKAQKINPCTACEYCAQKGACHFKDDMQGIYSALDEADVVLLLSPVYFNSVTGALKVLIDRCQIYWAKKFVLKQKSAKKNRKGYLIVSAGAQQTKETLVGSVKVADYFFRAQNVDFIETLCWDCTDTSDERYKQNKFDSAATSGEKLIKDLKFNL